MGTIREHASITSVKGIPRLLRTKAPFMQFVWSVSIVCFLVMATCQAVMLTMSYLEYSTVASIRELSVDVSGQSTDTAQLPDVTFCNVNPFSSNFTGYPGIPSIEEFISQVEDITRCDGCSEEQELPMLQLREELTSTRGYHMQIGLQNARRISHQKDATIASCHVWIFSDLHPSTRPCDNFVEIEEYHDSMFYNCFTIKFSDQQGMLSVGLILVFHIDSYDEFSYVLPIYTKLNYLNGMLFSFHARDTPPVLIKNQWLVQAGLFSDFKIRVQRHKRLTKPYGNCKDDAGTGYNDGRYSQLVCMASCGQATVRSMCGCIDYNFYTHVLSKTGDRPCLNMEGGRERLMKDWQCIRNARRIGALSCIEECPLACEERQFETKVSILNTDRFSGVLYRYWDIQSIIQCQSRLLKIWVNGSCEYFV